MHAANSAARDEPGNLEAIKVLLDAGTGSLGGTRPKASVKDGDRLLIAKFPHHADEWSVIAWEKSALDLAEDAGIVVPGRQLVGVEGNPVLLLDRFDRQGARRIGYLSAMTLLEAQDGQSHDYTEMAEAIPEYGSATAADLRQLWRRIAFSIAIHNTDDHLRNHGFLRHKAGWALAPAFDINPNPDLAAQRVTSIGGAANPSDEVGALLVYAESFDLTNGQARSVLREVADAAGNWAAIARRNGVAEAEIGRFDRTLEMTIEAVRAPAAGLRPGKPPLRAPGAAWPE
jgi:serine/threonine-protein kinase HipA